MAKKKNEYEPNKSYHAQNSNPKIQNPETKRLIRYMGIIKKNFFVFVSSAEMNGKD